MRPDSFSIALARGLSIDDEARSIGLRATQGPGRRPNLAKTSAFSGSVRQDGSAAFSAQPNGLLGGALCLALFIYHGLYELTPAQQAIAERVIRGRWIVVDIIVVFAFMLPLIALRFGGAFAYILTTKRMIVKVDRTSWLVRLFQVLQESCRYGWLRGL